MPAAALQETGSQVLSLGKIGYDRAPYERYMGIGSETMDAATFADMARTTHRLGREEGRTRAVVKGLVHASELPSLVSKEYPFPGRVEAAFPVDGDRAFVFSGWNADERGGAMDTAEVRRRVADLVGDRRPKSAGDHVARAAAEYVVTDYLPEGLEPDLHRLWKPRFGWSLNGVKERQQVVEDPTSGTFLAPVIRVDSDRPRIVGAATLETAQIGGVHMGEISELAVDPAEEGHGLVTAATAAALAQGVRRFSGRGEPFAFFGEFNLAAAGQKAPPPAVLVAVKTGLVTPDIDGTENILRYNVGVGDGLPLGLGEVSMKDNEEAGEVPVRSFQVMYLPKDNVASLYGPDSLSDIDAILADGERRLAHAGYPRTRS